MLGPHVMDVSTVLEPHVMDVLELHCAGTSRNGC